MGDSKRRPLAGRRSVLLGMAGLASAALAACSTDGGSDAPSAGPAPGSAGPATPPPSIAELSKEEEAAALAVRNHGQQAGGVDAGGGETTGGVDAGRGAPASNAVSAPPGREQILAEFSALRPKEWGLHVTGVVDNSPGRHVALTFDACGGPGGAGCDHKLLATLRSLKVPATLFVNSRWLAANPSLAADLAAEPLFELANHGTRHLPLSVSGRAAYGITGTASVADAYDELTGNQAVLHSLTGTWPRFFRPGTAYYDDVAAAMTRRLGMLPVNFSINGDGGATFPPATVAAEVGKVKAGDIVISHFNRPASGTAEGYARVLPRLLDGGTTFAQLGQVLPA
ncbi:polysaccharide deacetylase family protein [Paenarthrobacter sp. NPDC089714]|uniref:polysaccharide deacetylase family protein n=1 Tax=Paenarthrobacter sp. NPDC089714 TaxID=3364377 RepID=UPI0037F99E2A